MNRRELITLFAAAAIAQPATALAEQRSRPALVGIFTGTDPSGRSLIPAETDAFHQAMRDLGYIEGRDVSYIYRSNSGRFASAAELASQAIEFVRRDPDVIVSPGGVTSVRLLMQATSTIPIVMVTAQDAVENGVVSSLSRPGGHVTGLSYQGGELITKRLQLLQEALPPASRAALFFDLTVPQGERDEAVSAAQALGLEVRVLEFSGPDDFDGALAAAADWGAEALLVSGGTVTTNRNRFVALATRYRLPVMYHQNAIVHAGGLMSYGPHFPDLWRRAAGFVDKIFKGAKPADLPVEQPTKFELVVNLKAAKSLGLTIPPSILARADEVIE